ncbi:hypothetical protein [Spirosoma linguale]|uniref:Uncharacterized protein n=1 Tax=Spirosoma linguale (strain ATCC 33905 / DSM 74 / LMG 10896 / Claus 1) TaxID=504472 RepID=D2QLJ2_SPILD|nr:hypothetical protein Slin_4300 [Spirosoma linguale DSM 74]
MKEFTEIAKVDEVKYKFIDIDFEDSSTKNPAKNSSNWNAIEWVNSEQIVEVLFDKGTLLRAIADIKNEKVLAVYEGNSSYPFPKNAIIYNVDGSIHKVLTPPILIGSLASKYDKPIEGSCFGGLYPSWYTNSKGEKVVGIAIKFPPQYRNIYGDFFEVREINLESGEFGEVLQDGAV